MHFIIGLVVMGVGFLFIAKTEWFLSSFGRIGFFEQYLGVNGGSRLGYKLIGIVGMIIGFMIFTDMIGNFLEWLLAPLLRYSR